MGSALPRCSVVVPVRNDARMLERLLVALDRQRRAPDEIVIVDNGSDDDSARVATRRGTTVVTEPLVGIAAAAARGYDEATGDLILRLDADSVPPADWIARIVTRFAEDAELDALTGPGEFTAVPAVIRRPLTGWYWHIYFESLRRRIGGTPLFGSNLVMRSAAWRDVRPSVHRTDPAVHDDLDLSIHLLRTGHRLEMDPALRVAVSARPLVHPFGMLHRARRAAHTLALHTDASTAPADSACRPLSSPCSDARSRSYFLSMVRVIPGGVGPRTALNRLLDSAVPMDGSPLRFHRFPRDVKVSDLEHPWRRVNRDVWICDDGTARIGVIRAGVRYCSISREGRVVGRRWRLWRAQRLAGSASGSEVGSARHA
jgi:hypothetical protein